ncbi:MAG: tetratricopeptide repeat protein [Verrucomicrobiae bacterium]|nr:tetratricopeptide repeat protein [Verrucomicrobiae bacterium]
MSKPLAPKSPPVRKYFLAGIFLIVVFALGMAGVYWAAKQDQARVERSKLSTITPPGADADAAVFATYGTSPTCKSCHEEAYENWARSHHALAERSLDPALDTPAFDPPWRITHGTQNSEARLVEGKFQLVTQGLGGTNQPFEVARVIGVDPLLQYLIPTEGGRLQASELCYDPNHPGWFNVYGEEDRQAGEWGHWSGRGMNWNNMCANCHNTRLRKNYDEATDTYATSMAERGVGCEACHGPMADHNAWQARFPNQRGDPTVRRISREEMFSACAQCHSRRAELTGDYRPPENFFDHHQLTIPDETDIFYPDGQVRDEDYEVTAFLGSKMHAAGVRCVDCHEPHTSKVRLPGNFMCLSCHSGPLPTAITNALNTAPVGPRIDPETHSRHQVGTRGDFCTDCHMPQTVYMQRHPRHDHGFTSPDPRLTKELGIPNACNRCHTERTADWSLDYVIQWYGPRTNNTVLDRATTVAKARNADAAAVPGLLRMLREENIPLWRAVAANLLKRWTQETNVTAALLSAAGDTNELVRAMAVRGLEPIAQSGGATVRTMLNVRLNDPVRSVRVDAAWALRHQLDTNSTAGTDLIAYLRHNLDQPGGAMQMGVFQMDRSNLAAALVYFERAVKWDGFSAPLRHALAVAYSTDGRGREAVEQLQAAVRLAPEDAEYRYLLGLAFSETGNLRGARDALAEAVRLDPSFARAWYNLGLAQSALNQPEPAIESLLRAESLDAHSPMFPYARATILARLDQVEEARLAARRALELRPGFAEAQQLLQALSR